MHKKLFSKIKNKHQAYYKYGVALLFGLSTITVFADEQISIVGSSTVYPFTTVVAELFGQNNGVSTPKVESTGTGGGMKLLCAGIGAEHPDISNASRAIKNSEVELCASNGISEPLEIKIGYDGIVIATSNTTDAISLTLEQVFLALAREISDASGKLVANSNKQWSDIDPSLPSLDIKVYGPPPTSGTRDAFVELAMEEGCERVVPENLIQDKDTRKAICTSIREDGAFVEAGENDNLIIQRLVSNSGTLGIFGYSFLEENLDKVQGVLIDGVEPLFETIEQGDYALGRPLFIYVKKEHVSVKPDARDFVEFYVSEESMGSDGFLVDRGLVPLAEAEQQQIRDAVSQL